jgi:hypothetical protein
VYNKFKDIEILQNEFNNSMR